MHLPGVEFLAWGFSLASRARPTLRVVWPQCLYSNEICIFHEILTKFDQILLKFHLKIAYFVTI